MNDNMTPEERLLQAIAEWDAHPFESQGFTWDVAEAFFVEDWDPEGNTHFYGPFPDMVAALAWAEEHRLDRIGTDLENCEFRVLPLYKG
jgi:hypothetical protein